MRPRCRGVTSPAVVVGQARHSLPPRRNARPTRSNQEKGGRRNHPRERVTRPKTAATRRRTSRAKATATRRTWSANSSERGTREGEANLPLLFCCCSMVPRRNEYSLRGKALRTLSQPSLSTFGGTQQSTDLGASRDYVDVMGMMDMLGYSFGFQFNEYLD